MQYFLSSKIFLLFSSGIIPFERIDDGFHLAEIVPLIIFRGIYESLQSDDFLSVLAPWNSIDWSIECESCDTCRRKLFRPLGIGLIDVVEG